MEAPSYLLPRPPYDLTPEKKDSFEALFNTTPMGGLIDYRLAYPKWEYLSYLCDTRDLVMHGSQNLSIQIVEPRKAKDIKAFSSQHAIYATTDGIFVIYFAILDRMQYPEMSLFNSCLQARISPEVLSEPLYFFSITHSVLQKKPWCEGMIYILPRQNFVQEEPMQAGGIEIIFPHWSSSSPAQPVARILVDMQDFPFLSKIHGHNNKKLQELANADATGFPWPEALES